jgi:DNA-binding transcriptional regulator LsrR (DeoR family)
MDTAQDERSLLGKISWHYYIDGLTQKEIGERLGLSRLKIVRLLKRARAEGVVEIRIASDIRLNTELARGLEERFQLQEAIVTDPSADPEAHNAIGRAGAQYLERSLHDDLVLGIGMGRTVSSILEHMIPRKLDNATIRTLAGAYERPGAHSNAYNIAWRLADLLGATCEQLYCPLIVPDKDTRKALLSNQTLSQLLRSVSACDIALIGLGALDRDSPLIRLGYVSPNELAELRSNGAVGEILGRFYDSNGNALETGLEQRTLGIDLQGLCGVQNVIALAHGPNKVEPMLGALRTGCLDVLVTDRWTAESVLVRDDLKQQKLNPEGAILE